MASPAANKRLTREYKAIAANPPPFISAHPSDSNILEWHYLLMGPPATPYEGGQYWGTLMFPPDYPFKPPAIRMITPSGRFQPSTRLCLSISDFHPKSFNPAWEVSTILIGLLSFMTGDEMTTGSISATDRERRILSEKSRWWNSTGGGSGVRLENGNVINAGPVVVGGRKLGLGDAGRTFRAEWPELDEANWKWMREKRIDPLTGAMMGEGKAEVRRRTAMAVVAQSGGGSGQQAAVVVARGEGWLRRHRVVVGLVVVVGYVLLARAFE